MTLRKKYGKLLFAPWAANSPFYSARQFWYNPMKKLFKEMIVFDPLENLTLYGKEEMNKRFLKVVEKEQPDYLFLWLICSEFHVDALIKIKEISPKTKIINFAGDDDTRFDDYSIFNMLLVDYFLVTHREYLQRYDGRAFLSVAMDTDAFKPQKIPKKYDVAFIGTAKYDRPEFIKFLKDNGIKVRVFGAEWDHYSELKSIYGGRVSHWDFAKIIHQTRINLSFTKNHEGKKHLNQHTFEAGASREFVLTEDSKEYYDYFTEGKDLVSFKDKKELLEKVRYYLKHEKEREQIAERAYKIIIEKFSKDKEFEKVFAILEKHKLKEYSKGVFKSFPKAACLFPKDINLNLSAIKQKLNNFDYVYFKTEDSKNLPYREQLQAYSIAKLKKPISCCDFYFNSKGIGNYMEYRVSRAFKILSREDFSALLNINQLMVAKEYFLKNLFKFRDLFNKKKTEFISEKNTAFISFPLVQVEKFNLIDYDKMKRVWSEEFVSELKAAVSQGKLFYSRYFYSFILTALFKNRHVLRYLLEKLREKFA